MILVIGGRSKIGSALVSELVRKGESVRVMLRSSETADALPAGVEPVLGDLGDLATLRAALEGVEKLFLLCGPTEQEVALNRNAIDAAGDAGVRLLVRSSILGANPDSAATFVRDHGRCDAYLMESGLPHVIVRPNLFSQNVPGTTVPSIDANGSFYVNAGQARVSMVDTRDVADVAAAALAEDGHEGRTYDVTGPEALSYHDVATKLSSVLGRPVSYVDVPDDTVRQSLLGFGMSEWLVNGLVELYQDYRRSGTDGYTALVTDTLQRLTGRPARSLDQLLAEQAIST